jgi:pimeloyl-ACP methyl ester carboxylesterase
MFEHTFDDQGSKVRWYEIPGSLPAQVFLHGLGGTGAAAFGHIAGHPALGGHRTLVVDLPGHGLSDRPDGWSYTLESFAEVVAGTLGQAGLDAVDLVGHSMGGTIAIVLAYREPQLVGRLVISEANLDPLPPSPVGLGSQRIAAQGEEAFVATGFKALLESEPSWVPTMRLCDPRAVHRSAVGIVTGTRPTMREMLTSLQIPRTFIRGELGEELRDAAGLEAAGVRVVTLAGAGHLTMVDAPAPFIEVLVDAFR